jgi:nucleotide-binding universal stress UspA family protein
MDSGTPGLPVVVAIGNDPDGRALDWSAAEASVRGCALHVVHAERLRWAVDPSGLVPVADLESCRVAAENVLQAAVRRVRSVSSGLEISAQLLFGPTIPSLVAQGRHAQLLVLGSRRTGRPRGMRSRLSASLVGRLASRASCPVAIVRTLDDGLRAGAPPRVVVGVDGTTSGAALEFAGRAAAQRGVPLVLVHAWAPDLPADHEGVCAPVARSEAEAALVLGEILSRGQRSFPDLRVEPRLVCGDPAAALIRESEGAALLVLGTRGLGGARAQLFGSVSVSVTAQARCPAVVVRPGRRVQGTAAPPTDRTGREWAPGWRAPWE